LSRDTMMSAGTTRLLLNISLPLAVVSAPSIAEAEKKEQNAKGSHTRRNTVTETHGGHC
jgi:hypothetical protein